MKRALLLFLLLTLSFASQLWQFSTDGNIGMKPVLYQSMVVAGSDDGNIYALDPTTGSKKWVTKIGQTPNEVFTFDGAVVTSTSTGILAKIGSDGKAIWTVDLKTKEFNSTYVYGASANDNNIFVSANNGIFMFAKDGSLSAKLISYDDNILTPPAAGTNFVVFGQGNELVKVSDTGTVVWRSLLSEGNFWLSRPVIAGDLVYIGALDNRVHAFSLNNGFELWSYQTKNWVLSTPLVENGVVYVGSDDGGIYALDASGGDLKWVAQTQLAVQSQPESGTMGGADVIFVGSTDKSVYAISKDNGTIVWKGTAASPVGSPIFDKNEVIFGSADGKLSAYSTERACSITNPFEGDVIGLKEVVVTGNYVSQAGNAVVSVQVNSGDWNQANTSDVTWVYYLNPKADLNPGLNTISCKVTDAGGDESGPSYTTVAVTNDPSIPLSNLVVTVSPQIIEGKPLTIYVNDGDDGSPVDRFNLTFDGKSYFGSGNVNITAAPSAGTYTATVSKIGFNDATANVVVNSSGVNPIIVVLGALIIIIVVWQLWSRVLSKRFVRRK